MNGKRTVLVIIDGFGLGDKKNNNAIHMAKTPNFDRLLATYPNTSLEASGKAVGLPDGQIGNSEVGHMTIGCGCVMEQDLVRINKAIDDGSFYKNKVLVKTLKNAYAAKRPVHLCGLVSDGGVHSHIRHLEALIKMCRTYRVRPLLHCITDGRDTAPVNAITFIERIEPLLHETGGAIVSVIGRFYAMDRDYHWQRTRLAWSAIVRGEGRKANSAGEAIRRSYQEGVHDEFIVPAVLPASEPVTDGDYFIVFNFRNDRPRQLASALAKNEFDGFDCGERPQLHVTTLTEIDKDLPVDVAFNPRQPKTTLAKIISDAKLKQFHCAETEKYPHVTFFFNGGEEKPRKGETRHLVSSPRVETYDLKPEMSAALVTDAVIEAIENPKFAFIVVNFANTDMVGHTAVVDAIIKSVEVVDKHIGRVVSCALENDCRVLLTSDHGNCDVMYDEETRTPNTSHTPNPVPCLIIGNDITREMRLADGLNISSITPTVLDLMGLDPPSAVTSPSVILHDD